MTDKEYLQRSLVPGLQFELSDTRIRIVSDNTIFIHYLAVNKLVQEDVLKEYKELLALCRKYGVKTVYRNNLKKSLLALWGDYVREVDEYNALYKELLKRLERVEQRGIHMGYSDDTVLNDCIKFGNSLNPYLYRSSAISKVSEIYNEILSLKMEIRATFEHGPTTRIMSKVYL